MPISPTSLWYKDAIVYQIHVRAFCDSNGDGIGDFGGLTQKLAYLEGLGVNAVWLLPFYPSPLRDDGYDIANYTDVNPSYGTLHDFDVFLDEAHSRGLRVITELVLNHTSDQHEWFQRARRSPPGSSEREFYVWSDTRDKYRDARIIFQDFELSNWSWDPVAQAYYWHRFFHHQPNLNWDHPAVADAMFAVMDFWLERGVDGVRLDAVPYLYQREGTTCENLPETHAALKRLRRHVDERFEHRMLLAEANQWPEDAVAYFGEGDECHMAFHFPLMPRLFMAVQREDRFPVIDILQQTPAIPEICQWTTFLRNHDELTLEMVTDEERDYMYTAYAEDPQARVNLGIRRRLAPLLKNDRRRIELLNGLLFTLLGTPVVYYGDELGMGDNIYLGDRDAVRTPMQWSGDRNSGFSSANPQKLYLPVIVDPEFHYATVNVETQQDNRNSLLWWTRRLINLRKATPAFGRGSLEFLLPDNPKVLAFLREHEGRSVLVVANLSRFAQFVELDLSRFDGDVPIELFGKTPFPPIGKLPYLLTLGPYALELFSLSTTRHAAPSISERSLPTEHVLGDWRSLLFGPDRRRLEAALPHFLKQHAWFQTSDELIRSLTIESVIPLGDERESSSLHLLILHVEYGDHEPEEYAIPLAWASGTPMDELIEHHHERVVLRLTFNNSDEHGVFVDATQDGRFLEWWRNCIRARCGSSTSTDALAFIPSGESIEDVPVDDQTPAMQSGRPGSNWIRFGNSCLLRFFQRLDLGISPVLEMDQFLTRHAPKGLVPQWLGAWELRRQDRRSPQLLASLYRFVPHQGTAWCLAMDSLQRLLERVEANGPAASRGIVPRPDLSTPAAESCDVEPSEIVQEPMEPWLSYAQRIGERTGELHRILSATEEPGFQPQACTLHYQRSLFQSMRTRATRTWEALRRVRDESVTRPPQLMQELLQSLPAVIKVYEQLLKRPLSVLRMRCHGHYGLDKLLFTGKDFVVFDFQGDLRKSVGERRLKRPAASDLAALLWNLHQAGRTAGRDHSLGARPEAGHDEQSWQWIDLWIHWSTVKAMRGYQTVTDSAGQLGNADDELRTVLNAYMVDLAVDELDSHLKTQRTVSTDLLVSLLRLIPTHS